MIGTSIDLYNPDSYGNIEGISGREEDLKVSCLIKKVKIVEPKDNQLFIDIDSEDDLLEALRRIEVFEKVIGTENVKRTPSPSGEEGRYHIVIDLPFKVTPLEAVGLQALFNSDPKREFLNMIRVLAGEKLPNILFEKVEEGQDSGKEKNLSI